MPHDAQFHGSFRPEGLQEADQAQIVITVQRVRGLCVQHAQVPIYPVPEHRPHITTLGAINIQDGRAICGPDMRPF